MMILVSRNHLRRLLALLLLAAAGCGNASGQPAPVPTPTTGAQTTTALLVGSTNAPVRVPGSDGQEHVEYDLVLTNVFVAPVALSSIDVLDVQGATLLHLEGMDLVAQMQLAYGETVPDTQIAAAQTVATVMDVVLPAGDVPERLRHRIAYTLPDVPVAAIIGTRTIDGPELALDPRAPTVLAPPVHGPGWLNANGCCFAQTPHRLTRLVVDGAQWRKVETFAIDYVPMRDGRFFTGDGTRNEQWFGYGQEIVAAAAGTVIATRDDMPDQTPRQSVVGLTTPRDFGGNYVIVQIAPDAWATYFHLAPGSVAVSVGDRVAVGQHLGLLGNSGNSSQPHLHFQLVDSPEVLAGGSPPFVFSSYTLSGTIDPFQLGDAMSDPNAPPLVVTGPATAQRETYPLFATVVDFGG